MKILVLPCGSEIGLEIRRAFEGVKGVTLVGGSSVPDHGRFVYKSYREDLPNFDDARFLDRLNEIICAEGIELIFPAHDSLVLMLAEQSDKLACPVIGSSAETCRIARSKSATYRHFHGKVATPQVYTKEIARYPVFLKPDVGQGSKGTHVIRDAAELDFYSRRDPTLLILEYLPGEEYTVDCFTDRAGKLLFAGPRRRNRILNGISVGTVSVACDELVGMAEVINHNIRLNGAWFFQVKRSVSGVLTLMEIAPRIGGSSGLHRASGVNLPVLSYYNQIGVPVSIRPNRFKVAMDRAWSNQYKLDLSYQNLFIDFDDCLCIDGKLNPGAVKLLVQAVNQGKKVYLLSRHRDGPLEEKLKSLRVAGLFDGVYQIPDNVSKADYVSADSIFIDDSFAERQAVADKGIPVFAVDAIEALLCD